MSRDFMDNSLNWVLSCSECAKLAQEALERGENRGKLCQCCAWPGQCEHWIVKEESEVEVNGSL